MRGDCAGRVGRKLRRRRPDGGAVGAADPELARLAAHLLRDARPVRERVDGERPRLLTGPRTKTGFDPTDPAYYHGGDLAGLAANLQRIKDLGFTALWVTPVLKQDPVENGTAAYHGYWGLDFTTVDPHLGSDQDFADLVTKAHGLGLKVYLDVVVNHTADIVQLTGPRTQTSPTAAARAKRSTPRGT